jgi:diguanylate cyclase
LKDELKIFTESIKNLPAKKKRLNAGLLFEFLLKQYTDSAQQNALRELQKLLESDENTIEQATDLFVEIIKITEPELPKTEAIDLAEEEIIHIDVNIVSEQILQYLSVLGIPESFTPETDLLKETLLSPPKSAEDFEKTLNDTIQLLLKIKEFSDKEQKDIDQFLLQIATQLSELNVIVSEANSSVNHSSKTRNKLDQSVFTQIRELQIQAITTTSLDSLKDMVNQCFKTIATEIKTHYQQDKETQAKFQDSMAELVNKMIALELETENLKAELKVVHTQATHDTLTGLPNRNSYNQRLKDEIARYHRYKTPLTLAIWDIDHFKNINDTYGHKSGDKVLTLTAKQLENHTRDTDFIARFGGEEFVMLLPNTDKNSALTLINELREVIQSSGFNANGKAVPITISCGLTDLLDEDTEDSLFERADKALYEAKNQGRNRCNVL